MKKIWAVFMLYFQRPLFVILLAGLAVVMLVGKKLLINGQWILFDELVTVWLCIWMSLAFQSGIMIKRQMASPMAGLIPGYRPAHIVVGSLLWVSVALLTAWWLAGLTDIMGGRVKAAWIILCLGTYLATMVIAYISERTLLLIGYATLMFIVAYTRDLLHLLIVSEMALYALTAAGILLFMVFVWRLVTLREGMAEYSYILSWPLHRSGNRLSAPGYTYDKITPYGQKKNLLSRALHWVYVEHEDVAGTSAIFFISAGFFITYVLLWGGSTGFYMRPFSNFLVLTGVPLFIMLCFYYRVVAYRDYALLCPVRREKLAAEWGVLLAVALLGAWILTTTILGIVPLLLLGSQLVYSVKFWVYLLLTGVFVQMTLAWLTCAATWRDPRVVVLHVILYGTFMFAEYVAIPVLGTGMMFLHVILSGLAGVILARISYRRWCQEEV